MILYSFQFPFRFSRVHLFLAIQVFGDNLRRVLSFYGGCQSAVPRGLPLAALVLRAGLGRGLLGAWTTARDELWTSLALSAMSATAAVVLAMGLLFFVSTRGKAAKMISWIAYTSCVPFLISGPTLDIGLVSLWNRNGFSGAVYDSFFVIVLACVVRYLVFAHGG